MPPLWVLMATAALLTCMICSAGVLLVPAANVRIVPSSIALALTTDLTIDPSVSQVNANTRTIPARRMLREVKGSAQLKTTTEKSLPNAPSTGTVIFSNLRGEKTSIPKGTIVKTSGGVPVRFATTADAALPASVNSRVEVPIRAMDPGPSGNVKELSINTIDGALALEARVINLRATASGSNKPVKVVTADDKKKLETMLVQQLTQQGTVELKNSLKEGEILPAESVLVDIDTSSFDHVVDDPADLLTLTVSATAFGLAVNQTDPQTVLRSMIQKQIQAGYQMLDAAIVVESQPGAKYQGIALKWPIKATGFAAPQMDPSKISSALQGKSTREAADYLTATYRLAAPPEISTTPVDWGQLPWLGFRIAVFVEPQRVGVK